MLVEHIWNRWQCLVLEFYGIISKRRGSRIFHQPFNNPVIAHCSVPILMVAEVTPALQGYLLFRTAHIHGPTPNLQPTLWIQ